MPPRFVVAEADVEGRRAEGDTALEKVVLGPETGSTVLGQYVTRYAPGRSLPRGDPGRDELLYAVSGPGTLELEGEPYDLEPESGAYVRAGESYVIDNPGPEDLLVVSTTVPVEQVYRPPREVIVRFADRPELRADAKRTFRYLVNQDAGCMDATQFVGIVEPCRAPDHSHTYDEVGYIVEGEGFAHIDGESIPLRPGSCFHLPPEQVHCIENTGPGVMRILGVFHPSGDPASRAYEDTSQLAPAS
ncbi:MAG: cupin domain-containing protein [Actinobacteria bacterium]|nr:cupin domain-containing protein [Actinomycetota bacterium]